MENLNETMNEFAVEQGHWIPDNGDGTYKNPVIFADYSDPDVAAFEGAYYLIASSFNATPGIPVLRSTDLVNWSICSYVCENLPLPGYETAQHSKGIWAPSILEHNGELYVYVFTPDEGLFMSHTKTPGESWAPLHKVCDSCGWIDCTVMWDDDGTCYLVHGYAKSRIGFANILTLRQLSADGRSLLDIPGIDIFRGEDPKNHNQHITMEGPKLFKRNGEYYIIAPAGGIEHGYQAMMRSKKIEGPYEDRIVIHEHGNTGSINGPRQGNIVRDANGEEWFLHFRDLGVYGRTVCMEPVTWKEDGWAVFGVDVDGDGIGEPVAEYRKPAAAANVEKQIPQTSDPFTGTTLGKQWQWNANYRKAWYECTDSGLVLYAQPLIETGCLFDQPNIVSQKFAAPEFSAVVTISLSEEGVYAGMFAQGNAYDYLEVVREDSGLVLLYGRGCSRGELHQEHVLEKISLGGVAGETSKIRLGMQVRWNGRCQYFYEDAEKKRVLAGNEFIAEKDTWMGTKIGLYAIDRKQTSTFSGTDREEKRTGKSAVFTDFRIEE